GDLLLDQTEVDRHRSGASQRQAESAFLAAIDVARRQHATWHELRAAVSLGRLWQAHGRASEAYALIAEAYARFSQGQDSPELRAVQTLLTSLSAEGAEAGARSPSSDSEADPGW